MRKIKDLLEVFFFFLFTAFLYALFLLNLPLYREPHGLQITNELSDFSSTQITVYCLFASIVVCCLQGVLAMSWFPAFTAGMAANLWATTFFLLWVDSIFALSVQTQSFHYLKILGAGLLFLYLFFFALHYLDPYRGPSSPTEETGALKYVVADYWLGSWMLFYFGASIRLLVNSYNLPQFQWPLALGFCALCFLNYLLFLFLRKSRGLSVEHLSKIGRFFFVSWFLLILVVGLVQKWPF